jgi:membrane protease YdiL (CAAX protease family)
MRFSPDALPFTQYANFDKAAVGLIFLALLCRRASTGAEWLAMLRRTLPIAAVTMIVVLAIAVGVGFVAPQFKLPPYTPVFLATNLLFTCVAEEAFFRGFLQERLANALPDNRAWQASVVVFSGVLFGLAHLGGGTVYALLATLCGLGYAYAYAVTKRIEAPIIVHFAFNAIHFIGFTYPAIQPIQ